MASRFLALYGPAEPLKQTVVALDQPGADLRVAYSTDNFHLLTDSPTDTVPISEARGVLFGHVFNRSIPHRRIRYLATEMTSEVVRTEGRSLMSQVWGGYIAFVLDPVERKLCVVRDPSGTVPCLVARKGEIWAFASDVDTLIEAGVYKPRIDWANLTQHLRVPDLKTGQTALSGCHELLPAQSLTVSPVGLRRGFVWNPWDYVTPLNAEPEDVAAEIYTTVSAVVRAWSGCFSNVLLGVSGGLDSSILAASLSDGAAKWSGVTFATKHVDGDERPYARSLAAHLGFDLLERHHEISEVDIQFAGSKHLPLPSGLPYAQSHDHAKQALAKAFGFDAFFTGQGGDNVFCYMMSAMPLIDRLRAEGPSSELWTLLRDLCILTESGYLEVGRATFQAFRRRHHPYMWAERAAYLRDFSDPAKLDHPWLAAPLGALAGKGVHIAKILRILNTVDGYDRGHFGPLITPLTAQPIMELALRIPTWQWCRTGVNRMPVRDAFASRLPADLVNRISKAGPNSFAFEVVEANASQMTDFLGNGVLSERGLIDRAAVSDSLATPQLIRPPSHIDLMRLCEAEAWVRHWEGRST